MLAICTFWNLKAEFDDKYFVKFTNEQKKRRNVSEDKHHQVCLSLTSAGKDFLLTKIIIFDLLIK